MARKSNTKKAERENYPGRRRQKIKVGLSIHNSEALKGGGICILCRSASAPALCTGANFLRTMFSNTESFVIPFPPSLPVPNPHEAMDGSALNIPLDSPDCLESPRGLSRVGGWNPSELAVDGRICAYISLFKDPGDASFLFSFSWSASKSQPSSLEWTTAVVLSSGASVETTLSKLNGATTPVLAFNGWLGGILIPQARDLSVNLKASAFLIPNWDINSTGLAMSKSGKFFPDASILSAYSISDRSWR